MRRTVTSRLQTRRCASVRIHPRLFARVQDRGQDCSTSSHRPGWTLLSASDTLKPRLWIWGSPVQIGVAAPFSPITWNILA
jgi:hypothetical protein